MCSTFSTDERLVLYNYCVSNTQGPPELPEFNTLVFKLLIDYVKVKIMDQVTLKIHMSFYKLSMNFSEKNFPSI